jgi:hypothetical protein
MTNRPGVPDHAAPDDYEIYPGNKTEPKVKAATIGSGAGAILTAFSLYLIDNFWYNGEDTPEVPFAVASMVGLVVTSGLTFAGGWWAKHVNR